MPQYKKQLKKGVRWFYKFSYQGLVYRTDAIYLTKTDAKKAEVVRYKEVVNEANKINQNNDMTLLELINLRLDYLQAWKSNRYYQENKKYFQELYSKFGDILAREISKQEFTDSLIEISKRLKMENKDNYVVNARIRIYKALFSYGIKSCGLSIQNPCEGIGLFPVVKKLKYISTDDEIKQLLELCTLEQRQLVEFVRDTGCRISEALYLRAEDVFDNYVVFYTRKSKNSNLVPRNAKYDIRKLPEPDENGQIFKNWSDVPKFLAKKTKRKWNWHNLRHRFASLLSKKNTPIFEIMSQLGHSNIETTQRYLQLLPDIFPSRKK
jgi:integrase